MDTCSGCAREFDPAPWQTRTHDHHCKGCHRAKDVAYRKRRNAEGRPLGGGGRMSREYHREYERNHRERPGVRKRKARQARVRRKRANEQIKMAARQMVRAAIRAGLLERLPCEICAVTPTDGHHHDYAAPLDVRWLCRRHHTDEHAKAQGVQS